MDVRPKSQYEATVNLARRAAAGDLSPVVAEWITSGLSRFLAGDDLAVALQLDRASLLRQRTRALQDAAALLDEGDGAWAIAGRLAAAVSRYKSRIQPLLQRNPEYQVGAIDTALRRAFDTGAPIPSSKRRLYDVIK